MAVHRIDKVVPDLDDFQIKPNEARYAANMRFAASVGSTNLAMTLVNGMAQVNYSPPLGDNLVVGVKEDFETQAVYFALYNSNGNGGIYQIKDGIVSLVLEVASDEVGGFTADSDVSIAIIDGKIYWTDNVNQPRMCNIEKGIAGDYPSPLEEWMITQIKRQPGLPLDVSPDTFTLNQASVDFDNEFKVPDGYQYSYFYIYDNNEESRIAPASPVIWDTTNVTLTIPSDEYTAFLDGVNIVSQVVFIFRKGNDGPWYEIERVNNDGSFTGTITLTNVQSIAKSTVSVDITDIRFDSVPLLSASNEVAQNRLTHGNVKLDYPPVTSLSLTANTNNVVNFPDPSRRVCKPNGQYKVGVEVCDLWGRTNPVTNTAFVTIPNYRYATVNINGSVAPVAYLDDEVYNQWVIDFSLEGDLPDWGEYVRVVFTRVQNYTNFLKTYCKIYDWYEDSDEEHIFSFGSYYPPAGFRPPPQTFKNAPTGKFYNRRGYALELSCGEPFLFDNSGNQYLRIAQEFVDGTSPSIASPKEYKIFRQAGNFVYIETSDRLYTPSRYNGGDITANPVVAFDPCYYQVEFAYKNQNVDDTFYQSTIVLTKDQYEAGKVGGIYSGRWYGDVYLNKSKKVNRVFRNTVGIYTPGFIDDGFGEFFIRDFIGPNVSPDCVFVSMNPTDNFSQIWSSDIGQENVVNQQHEQKLLPNTILFSSPLIQGTQINGLSKFNSVDNRQAPLENGPITALVRTSATQKEPGVLLAIGKNGASSFYYDGIQLTNIDGSSNVSTSDKYLASQRPLVGLYGCNKLRNICVTPLGKVYWWSESIKDWIRYSQAGLEQLGETYQFMNFARTTLENSENFICTYDQITDEAILIGDGAQALVFTERYKSFQGVRDYLTTENITPERAATLNTSTFFFLEGAIWEMKPSGVVDNSFFGEIKDPSLSIVTNEAAPLNKMWNSIKVMGPRPSTCQVNSGEDEQPVRQSYIDEGWWINRKGEWDAAIRKDENSVGGVMNGINMESRILISTFAWDASQFYKLNFIEVKSNKSIVQ